MTAQDTTRNSGSGVSFVANAREDHARALPRAERTSTSTTTLRGALKSAQSRLQMLSPSPAVATRRAHYTGVKGERTPRAASDRVFASIVSFSTVS
jgi:hypothetical protein